MRERDVVSGPQVTHRETGRARVLWSAGGPLDREGEENFRILGWYAGAD